MGTLRNRLLVAAVAAALLISASRGAGAALPATTIADLHQIVVVGSTAHILDAQGHPLTVDATPYGVAIAPPGTKGGTLRPGDVVVTNFGAKYTGTTLVRFAGGAGPGTLFGTTAAGPVAEAFIGGGNDWVANFSANNVQIFSPNGGAAVVTITNPLFKQPWGQAFNGGVPNPRDGSVAAFFSTNLGDGTIDRIDIVVVAGKPRFRVFQIGKLPTTSTSAVPLVGAQGMVWMPTWAAYGRTYQDVLFVVDPAANRIAAYPNSSTVNTTSVRSTDPGLTVFRAAPLRTPAGIALNPLNGDLLVVNQSDNNLVELRPSPAGTASQVVAVRRLDQARVDQRTGAGSALFGLAATTDAAGNLKVFFGDDNTNTLDALVVGAPSAPATGGNQQGSPGQQTTPSPVATSTANPVATSTPSPVATSTTSGY